MNEPFNEGQSITNIDGFIDKNSSDPRVISLSWSPDMLAQWFSLVVENISSKSTTWDSKGPSSTLDFLECGFFFCLGRRSLVHGGSGTFEKKKKSECQESVNVAPLELGHPFFWGGNSWIASIVTG